MAEEAVLLLPAEVGDSTLTVGSARMEETAVTLAVVPADRHTKHGASAIWAHRSPYPVQYAWPPMAQASTGHCCAIAADDELSARAMLLTEEATAIDADERMKDAADDAVEDSILAEVLESVEEMLLLKDSPDTPTSCTELVLDSVAAICCSEELLPNRAGAEDGMDVAEEGSCGGGSMNGERDEEVDESDCCDESTEGNDDAVTPADEADWTTRGITGPAESTSSGRVQHRA